MVSTEDFRQKYQLESLYVSDINMHRPKLDIILFIKTQEITTSSKIVGLVPEKYIVLVSKVNKNILITPLLTYLGVIFMFIVTSIIMYKGIKKKLHEKIGIPLKYTLNCATQGTNWFDKNTAASEIVELYEKTTQFIQTLLNQRDVIEKQNIESAKYHMAVQIAHDIRSPVLALHMLSEHSAEPDTKRKIMLQDAINRISQIADNILAEHKLQNIGCHNQSYSSLARLIQNLIREKEIIYQNKKIHFIVTMDESSHSASINIPDALICRIISNLLNNAIESLVESGQIKFSVISKPEGLELSINDSGQGIPPENLHRIFKKGFSDKISNGNGLGLSYAKEVVESYGGKISMESKLGVGSTVILQVPYKS